MFYFYLCHLNLFIIISTFDSDMEISVSVVSLKVFLHKNDIVFIVLSFVPIGQETTANTLSFLIFELLTRPDVMER